MGKAEADEVCEGGVDEMSIREIVIQALAVGTGFFAGMLAMRENYLGVIRNLKEIIKEYERRA